MKLIDIHTHAEWDNEIIQIKNISINEVIENSPKDFFSVGIHPWFINQNQIEDELRNIESQINNMSLLAIGECGLDKVCKSDFSLQLKVLDKHILLSEKYKKPLILHIVKAFNEIIQLRLETSAKQPWIIHGFNASPQLANQLIKLGFFLSFGSHLQNNNSKARKSIASVPLDRIFLETDNADISINEIYSNAANSINMQLSELQKRIAKNFQTVFG